jgi:endonuclease YncB( thermonuclease family)
MPALIARLRRLWGNFGKSLLSRAGVLLLLLGLCTQVNDGDTITVKMGSKYRRIRLAGIDAPELGQKYGPQARAFLNQLCYRRQVTLLPLATDAYGRMVAQVRLADGQNLNRAMVRHGYAWYFNRYQEDKELARLQAQARKARLGLWSQKQPQPPWQWRRQHPR